MEKRIVVTSSIVFPSQMFEPKQVADSVAEQRGAAQGAGLTTFLVNQESLDEGDFNGAVRGIDARGTGVYRG